MLHPKVHALFHMCFLKIVTSSVVILFLSGSLSAQLNFHSGAIKKIEWIEGDKKYYTVSDHELVIWEGSIFETESYVNFDKNRKAISCDYSDSLNLFAIGFSDKSVILYQNHRQILKKDSLKLEGMPVSLRFSESADVLYANISNDTSVTGSGTYINYQTLGIDLKTRQIKAADNIISTGDKIYNELPRDKYRTFFNNLQEVKGTAPNHDYRLWTKMTDYHPKKSRFVYLTDSLIYIWDLSDPEKIGFISSKYAHFSDTYYYYLPDYILNMMISADGEEVIYSAIYKAEIKIERMNISSRSPEKTVFSYWLTFITDDLTFTQSDNYFITATYGKNWRNSRSPNIKPGLVYYNNSNFTPFEPQLKLYQDSKKLYGISDSIQNLADTTLRIKLNIGHRRPVWDLDSYTEKDLLLTFSKAEMIIWEKNTRRELFRYNSSGETIIDVCFNTLQNHILLAESDSILVYNIENFKIIKCIRPKGQNLQKIEPTMDGMLVHFDGSMLRYNKNYNLLSSLDFKSLENPSVSKDGKSVFIFQKKTYYNEQQESYDENRILQLSLLTFDTLMVYKLPKTFKYSTFWRWTTAIEMNNAGNKLAVCNGVQLLLFDIENQRELFLFDSLYRHNEYYEIGFSTLEFSPDDRYLLCTSSTGTQGYQSPEFITAFDLSAGEAVLEDQSASSIATFLTQNELVYLADTSTDELTGNEISNKPSKLKKINLQNNEYRIYPFEMHINGITRQNESLIIISDYKIFNLDKDLVITDLYGGLYENIEDLIARNNKLILLSEERLSLCDMATLDLQRINVSGVDKYFSSYDFLNDNELIFTSSDSILNQYNTRLNEHKEINKYGEISHFLLSPDKEFFALGKKSGGVDLIDLNSQKLIHTVSDKVHLHYLNNDFLFYSSADILHKFDLNSAKIVNSLSFWNGNPRWSYSSDRIDKLSGSIIKEDVILLDSKSLDVINSYPSSIVGRTEDLVFVQGTGIVFVYSIKNNGHLYTVPGRIIKSSLSQKYFFTIEKNRLWMWNTGTAELLYDYTLKTSVFTENGKIYGEYEKLMIIDDNGILQILDIETRRWISLYLFSESNWLTISQDGLFDGTETSFMNLFFIKDNNTIGLDQLKARFYDPGLLSKFMGFNNEPLRQVDSLQTLELYPEIKTSPIENGLLHVDLTDRGGGIGNVIVTINRKEIDIAPENRVETNPGDQPLVFRSADKKTVPVRPAASPSGRKITLIYNLNGHPYLLPGVENEIEVKAYNGENWLISRGVKELYTPKTTKAATPPNLYALIAGAGNYRGDYLDLAFASKDAADFAAVLGNSSGRLFGVGNTFITLLNTDGKAESYPTRENLKKAVEGIAAKAQSGDIFIFYLAGHGTNWGGQDGDFYFLTSDALDGNLNDPAIRNSVAVSGSDITQWFKKVAALKQVLIMDVCHSGKLADDLMAARSDMSSSVIRSYERMKDRTGMYILAGSAADAVSYETSIYGQGLLTYSLIFGMKGAALRDGEFVDVMKLFQHSADQVPQLAQGIGGIQRPQVRTPYGGQSFDIGRITSEDQTKITLKSPKPMFLRSSFQDEEQMDDVLGLSDALDAELRDLSSRGGETNIVFIDASRFSEAYKITGRYTSAQGKITANIILRKGDAQVTKLKVEATNTEGLVGKIVEEVMMVAKR